MRHLPYFLPRFGTRLLAILALSALLVSGRAMAALDPLVSASASPEAANLQHYLQTVSGQKILAGQQEFPGWSDESKDTDLNFILQTTGKVPAVRGFDFLFYTHSAGGRAGQRSSERAIDWARAGGIVAFCCHWFTDIGSPAGSPQFYTAGANAQYTTFDIRQAVIAGTPENTEFLAKLDLLAGELQKLRDANIPVIWRPFHECSGGWFWWGGHGAEPFKQAWRIMFDRFTRQHGLNNLIWCFNPTDSTTNMQAWYPGDDVVDMISLDVYPSAGSHPTYAADYARMRDFRSGRKLVAMSENGAIPDPDQLFGEGAGWAYFSTWNGFESNTAQNATAFLQRVYNHDRVITRDELPDIYHTAPAMITQPASVTVWAPTAVLFSVSATGVPRTFTYRWQHLINGGNTWTDLANDASFEGVDTASLLVDPTGASLSGDQFRCIVSNGTSPDAVSASATLTVLPARPAGFDAAGYLTRNPDVAAAIGNVADKFEKAWQHYISYGMAEGRRFSDDFQVDDYLAINPDLQAVFGTDRVGALNHWLTYGKLEGRMGCVPPEFELDTYFALNPDVLAVFGNNRRLAWFHYATYGILEGRSLDGWFTPAAYLAMYPDLVPALSGKPLASLGHWFRYGRAEGRGIPAWFDIVGYLARYPDVEAAYGTDLYGAWRHFVRWGAAAGRSPDPKFDPVAYLAAYPELRAGLGNDPVKALQHWIDWGKQEGRLGSIPAGWDPAYYLAHNPDLAAFGDDAAILWQHCIAYGVLEGREVAVDVKPSVYLALNPDLNVALGGSQQKAMLHWYLYGKAEGRLGR